MKFARSTVPTEIVAQGVELQKRFDREPQTELLARVRAFVALAVDAMCQQMQVSCQGKGCSGCCCGAPELLPFELEDITCAIPKRVWYRVAVLEQFLREKPDIARCPCLNKDGLCDIYEHRPLSCRSYFVVSPKELCYSRDPNVSIKRCVPSAVIKELGLLYVASEESLTSLLLRGLDDRRLMIVQRNQKRKTRNPRRSRV